MSFLFTFSSDENMNDGVLRVWVDGILNIDLSTVPRVAKRTVTSGLWSTIGCMAEIQPCSPRRWEASTRAPATCRLRNLNTSRLAPDDHTGLERRRWRHVVEHRDALAVRAEGDLHVISGGAQLRREGRRVCAARRSVEQVGGRRQLGRAARASSADRADPVRGERQSPVAVTRSPPSSGMNASSNTMPRKKPWR